MAHDATEGPDGIIAAAREAASLPVGTRIRCAGAFGIRWGRITSYDAADDTYSVLIDEADRFVTTIDIDHIVEVKD